MRTSRQWKRQVGFAFIAFLLGFMLRHEGIILVEAHESAHLQAAEAINVHAERISKTMIEYQGGFNDYIQAAGYKREAVIATVGMAAGLFLFFITATLGKQKPQAWFGWFWIGVIVQTWYIGFISFDMKVMVDNGITKANALGLMFDSTIVFSILFIVGSVAIWFIPQFFTPGQERNRSDATSPIASPPVVVPPHDNTFHHSFDQ